MVGVAKASDNNGRHMDATNKEYAVDETVCRQRDSSDQTLGGKQTKTIVGAQTTTNPRQPWRAFKERTHRNRSTIMLPPPRRVPVLRSTPTARVPITPTSCCRKRECWGGRSCCQNAPDARPIGRMIDAAVCRRRKRRRLPLQHVQLVGFAKPSMPKPASCAKDLSRSASLFAAQNPQDGCTQIVKSTKTSSQQEPSCARLTWIGWPITPRRTRKESKVFFKLSSTVITHDNLYDSALVLILVLRRLHDIAHSSGLSLDDKMMMLLQDPGINKVDDIDLMPNQQRL
jgi:hypothetical protein